VKKVTIVGMIYKSVQYLDFMIRGIKKYCLNSTQYDVDYLIVANDATAEVLQKLKEDNINHIIYKDSKPGDYYLNRTYRAWNYGGRLTSGEIIVFINSDMAFSSGWLENNLSHLNSGTIPCSRLIESGKLLSGQYALSKDFGRHPCEFEEEDFLKYANFIKINGVHEGGLFMPCSFYKKDFVASGGYPEGNIYEGGEGVYGSKYLQSGDDYFFKKNPVMKVKKHITVFDSIVYHIQEGELDE